MSGQKSGQSSRVRSGQVMSSHAAEILDINIPIHSLFLIFLSRYC